MRAIVVGHTGQDGQLLCNKLESLGYGVFGFSSSSCYSTENYDFDFFPTIFNMNSIRLLLENFKPTQIYYLPAYHRSSEQMKNFDILNSFDMAERTHVYGLLNFLIGIRDFSPKTRLFYAGSSLVFNGEDGPIQNEETRYTPVGFYAISKAQGIWLCQEFRRAFGVFASTGILYNHESCLRPPHFLSQKIIRSAIRISVGSKEKLVLGDFSARVDWGYAPDYVDAFQRILGLELPQDFIVATGEAHTVEEFVRIVFDYYSLNWKDYVVEDNSILQRRTTIKIGDYSKLRKKTQWNPSFSFEDFVRRLIMDTEDYLLTH